MIIMVIILAFLLGLLLFGIFSLLLISLEIECSKYVYLIVLIVSFLIAVPSIVFTFYGFPYSTGIGEHLGYITASETTGIIFKTLRIYFKTSLRSSQEDKYCVIDRDVYKRLQKVKPNQQIDIYYTSYLFNGIKNCEGEKDVITGFGVVVDKK